MLKEYVIKIYPIRDPTDNKVVETFDPCFDNWIGKEDWNKIINGIKNKLQGNNKQPPNLEREFYNNFLEWIEKELEWADIIVIDSNL